MTTEANAINFELAVSAKDKAQLSALLDHLFKREVMEFSWEYGWPETRPVYTLRISSSWVANLREIANVIPDEHGDDEQPQPVIVDDNDGSARVFEPHQPADTYTPPGEAPEGHAPHVRITTSTVREYGKPPETRWHVERLDWLRSHSHLTSRMAAEAARADTIASHPASPLPAPLPSEGDIKELVEALRRIKDGLAHGHWAMRLAEKVLEKYPLQ